MISSRQQTQERSALHGDGHLPMHGHQCAQRDDNSRYRHPLAVAIPEIATGEERQPHAVAGQPLDLPNSLAKRIGNASWVDHVCRGFGSYHRSHRTIPHYAERLRRQVVTIHAYPVDTQRG